MNSRLLGIAVIVVAAAALATVADAQQRGRGRGAGGGGPGGGQQRAIPAAPRGLPVPNLPADPIVYQTGEGMDIRVHVLARNLEHPWGETFLPDGTLLITERPGRLRIFRNGRLDPVPVAGVPPVQATFIGGLYDVDPHPDYANNHIIYLTYDAPTDNGAQLTVARAVLDLEGHALKNFEKVFEAVGSNQISRMLFAPDGKLYVSVYGDPGQMAQDTKGLSGKVLRLNYDGSVPEDNPFVGKDGYRPEIYTLGHRSPEGLVWHNGHIWEVEMGPNGGDEVNVLEAGGNYGWPNVSLGRDYSGSFQPDKFHRDGMIDPVVSWVPSVSTSGIEFYTGDKLAAWKGNLFVGGVRYGEIPGTGSMTRVVLNDKDEEIRRELLLTDLRRRIRDIRQGPDELLYILTDEDDGALLRIEPAD